MTAAELIALLKSHPKACGRLGITNENNANQVFTHAENVGIYINTWDPREPSRFLNWLTGAATHWCDEHGVGQPWITKNKTFRVRGHFGESGDMRVYRTRSHALLAAIEAAEETT
jgi:hypothetical protein